MAWNPTPEVAVARDAAKALGDVPMVVVMWVSTDGQNLGVATYGKTKELCGHAAELGKVVFNAAKSWGEE